ncbi:MAG: DUF115 domain-containing protein [Spirochaetes bacterium]|nr:DUF115 domain-containing protein [Spirochaetota bacterium]
MEKRFTYTIEIAKDGFPTIVACDGLKRIPLHSTHRPSQEGHAFQENFNPEKFDILIVLGVGLGYHLSGIADFVHRYRRIILIEYLKGLNEEIKRNNITSFLLNSPNIVYFSGLPQQELFAKLKELVTLENAKGIQVLEHPASMRIFSEYYQQTKIYIEKLIQRSIGNIATRAIFSRRFFKNATINIRNISLHAPFSKLYEQFNGYSALVVASAPSLDQHLENIHHLAHNAIIIAVDSALPVLIPHGIVPDFFVSIDPQPMVFEHLHCFRPPTVPLITLTSHPYAFSRSQGFLSLNSHPWSQFLQEALPFEIGSFNSTTGSVAGDALMAAMKMGFTHIGIIGFDSAFPKYCTYARGSAYHRRWSIVFHNRFLPAETKNLLYIMQSSGATRNRGFYTRKSFLNYWNSVNELIANRQKNAIYHILPAAIPLENAIPCSFDEFRTQCLSPVELARKKIAFILSHTRDVFKEDALRFVLSLLAEEVIERIIRASFLDEKEGLFNVREFLQQQKYLKP